MTEPEGQEDKIAAERVELHILPNTKHRLEEERRQAMEVHAQRTKPLTPLNEAPILRNTTHREQAEDVARRPMQRQRIIKAT
jgi:hypothetical protein